jgi:TPP-dependent pyruvate/acetoin dehydrogenase alpha subunit
MDTKSLLKEAKNIPLDKDLYTKMFKDIVRVRVFEEETIQLFQNAKIIGYLHPSIGNEAAEVGAARALNKGDIVFPTHRGHGFFVARGADLGKLMAELMGRETGYCKGRGGDLHMGAPEVGIMQVQGILGAQLPNAVGTALAHRNLKNGKVTLCAFGDGAAGNGSFHESLNLASIWKLPVVFACINNGYAASFSFKKSTSVPTNALRAVSYSMPGYDVDGRDVWKVYCTAKEAVERARAGEGPSLMQLNTFRWKGHDPNDDAPYRPKEELLQWEFNDPVKISIKKILDEKLMSQADIDKLYDDAKKEVKASIDFGLAQPMPTFEGYLADVEGKY